MDGLLPEMGIRRCAESHRDVRELDVRAPEDADRHWRGFPNGAGLPFPVTKAVPVTTKPPVAAGLNAGNWSSTRR